MKQLHDFRWNVPNVLSLYRLLSFPLILALIFMDVRQAFVILFTISLLTDFLDGFIARTFKLQTEAGAFLDSIADFGTYILAIAGIVHFEWQMYVEYSAPILIFLGLYFAGILVAFVKFRKMAALHNYSFKITAYLQGIFFFVLFNFGFYDWFFWLMILVGIAASVEELVMLFLLSEPRPNAKGLYWLLKELKANPGKNA